MEVLSIKLGIRILLIIEETWRHLGQILLSVFPVPATRESAELVLEPAVRSVRCLELVKQHTFCCVALLRN